MGLRGDPIVQGDAGEREVRTPPLWGLRNRDPMLHNGDANAGTFEGKIEQVVEHHFDSGFGISESTASAQAYMNLSASEQQAVIDFLASLGLTEFDWDGNNLLEYRDFHGFGDAAAFMACYGGGPYTPDDDCAIHDINQDGFVDDTDFVSFMDGYNGPRRDCNNNGVVDLQDMLDGILTDADFNGFADECEPTCATDLDGNGVTDVFDLLDLLADWGACEGGTTPCEGDVNLDGIVDVFDLLDLLAEWNGCG